MDELRKDDLINEPDVNDTDAGLGRRELLRRGAALGAAMAVAAPVVQGLGRVPAFAEPSPPPPPPPPPPTGYYGISFVGIVFTCDGVLYRAKWEEGKGWEEIGANTQLPSCEEPAGWLTAAAYQQTGNIGVAPTYDGKDLINLVLTLPASCTAAEGAGVVKGGQVCMTGTVNAGPPTTITFVAPPKYD
jgi:hypothetical protein